MPILTAFADPPDLNEVSPAQDLILFTPHKSAQTLQNVLEHLPQSEDNIRGELLFKLGKALFLQGEMSRSRDVGKELEDLGRKDSNNSLLAKGLLTQAYVLSATYEDSGSQVLFRRAKLLADQTNDVALKVRATVALGESLSEKGQGKEGLALLNNALALAKSGNDAYSESLALRARASHFAATADYANALRDVDRLLFDAGRSKSAAMEAVARLYELRVASRIGDSRRASMALSAAIALLEECGADESLPRYFASLSDLELSNGRYMDALHSSTRALDLANKFGDGDTSNSARFNHGIARIYLGDLRGGKSEVEAVLKSFKENASALLEYASALAQAGDASAAFGIYQRAFDKDLLMATDKEKRTYQQLQRAYRDQQRQIEVGKLQAANLLQANELREQQQQRWNWGMAIGAVSILLGISGFFSYRQRTKNRELALQRQELAIVNRKLQWQSDHDTLTGLFNRRFFEAFMSEGHAPRTVDGSAAIDAETTGALFLIDVDYFKSINDMYGHSAGDEVLKELSRSLRSVLRKQDLLVRWGGEEFLIFLPSVSNAEAAGLAQRMLDAISSLQLSLGGKPINVSISAGYCPVPVSCDGVQTGWECSVRLADAALYFAKNSGRNRAYGIEGPVELDAQLLANLQSDFAIAVSTNAVRFSEIKGVATA